MKILISGSNGFIGSSLMCFLKNKGYHVTTLKRNEYSNPLPKIEQSDIIIHLAGAPILKRWSKKYKNQIINSRVNSTKNIVEAIHNSQRKPQLLISTSAIGIYSSEQTHCEASTRYSDDFLGEVCKAWEHEAQKTNTDTRLAIFRLGIVLGKSGGALPSIIRLFKFGLGGKIGNGKQAFSWIHIHDLLNVYDFVINNKSMNGPINLVSPSPTSNKVFVKTLSKTINRLSFFSTPKFLLRLIYGEASTTLTNGQFVYPRKLLSAAYKFEYPELNKAIEEIVSSNE